VDLNRNTATALISNDNFSMKVEHQPEQNGKTQMKVEQ